MAKKISSVFLAAVLLLGMLCFPAAAAGSPFSDISSEAYYCDAVTWAYENNVTSGTSDTTFSPDATCTRAQVVTFLWRAQGKPEPVSAANAFRDIADEDYFYQPVLWAVENGITNGTSDTTFSPQDICTHAQVLTFLWRAENKPAANGTSTLATAYAGTFFENAVAWADTNGMLSDMGSTVFNASKNCPRSDIVTYLYRFHNGTAVSSSETKDSYVRLTPTSATAFTAADVPAYSGADFVVMNGNNPYFSPDNLTTDSYELYGALDELGRCTTCVACVGLEIMPTEARGSIGSVKPTGWHTVKYDSVDGRYLYNRSHLIGYQLTGENANVCNLITGTRFFNLNMLDYENLIAEYVEDYDAHVLYRVTPVFRGSNLLADGLLMEGMSVEDQGKSVKFCVFMYNVQPGIVIDYATGDSYEDSTAAGAGQESEQTESGSYVLNTNSGIFHLLSCAAAKRISAQNRRDFFGTREEIIGMGYRPCQICYP